MKPHFPAATHHGGLAPAALPTRRSVLASLAAGLLLPACGGGDEPEASPQLAAQTVVRLGVVGAVFGRVTAEQVQAGASGWLRQGQSAPMRSDVLTMIGSNTKAMTSALCARMIERGALSWQRSVGEGLPELVEAGNPYASVTLEQLLDHRGGVLGLHTDPQELERFVAYRDAHVDEWPDTLQGRRRFFARWLLAQPPAQGVVPGRDLLYSNAGYVLAATLLEAATGQGFEALFGAELAVPLGLQAHWQRPEQLGTDQPFGHQGEMGAFEPVALLEPDDQAWIDVLAPAGLLTLPVPDYARWLQLHLRALSGATHPLPTSYIQRLKALRADDYALGWVAIALASGPVLAHSGDWEGFSTLASVSRDGRLALFGNTNASDANGAGRIFPALSDELVRLDAAQA